MIQMIYDFIKNTVLGQCEFDTNLLAILMTYASMILIFLAMVKFVIWFFKIGRGITRWRK